MKRLELALATTSLELDDAPTRPPEAETKMRPYLDLKGLAKGVEIVARSKVKLLARSIDKWCGDGRVEALPGQTGGARAGVWPPDGQRGLMTVGHHRPDLNWHEPFQFD